MHASQFYVNNSPYTDSPNASASPAVFLRPGIEEQHNHLLLTLDFVVNPKIFWQSQSRCF
jgi:hypothetical protein